jgi:signal transduction histidine kinase
MATIAAVPRFHGRLRLGGRSARLRLTLLYSGMFLALGTTLIAIIFLVQSTGAPLDAHSVAVAHPIPPGAPDINTAVTQQHSADLSRLLAGAWLTLLMTAVASALIGWFVAGRVLRPLRDMTTTARTITAGNLHERLALAGPDDEFKRLGDTIDDLLARLEASFAAQRRFVANAAHELRTPLTVERTLLQVALADPDAGAASFRETCEELLDAGRDHERLLESLLTLATSERGLEQAKPVDLANVSGEVVEASRARISAAQVELSTSLAPAVVNGDRALLQRLVANLIDNAVSYNRPGGRIDVRVTVQEARAALTVANTGQQIPATAIERLFEPFRRLRPDREADEDGHHGLGLSIVQATAAAHHAIVTTTPGPDGGLAITVDFPMAASALDR